MLFKNFKTVFGGLLVLPFSDMSVETIFSNLRSFRSDRKNKLKFNTIGALLHAKEDGLVKFKTIAKILKRHI